MEPFIGQIQLFGFGWAPQGWATCDGQLLSISSNTALFSLLGTTYGGDGRTTFALPDLRGRVPLHQGQGPGLTSYVLGEVLGQESVALTTQQMPSHTHGIQGSATAASKSPRGGVPGHRRRRRIRARRRHADGERHVPAVRPGAGAREQAAGPGDELVHRRRGHLPVPSLSGSGFYGGADRTAVHFSMAGGDFPRFSRQIAR